jgi:hypothetical protein
LKHLFHPLILAYAVFNHNNSSTFSVLASLIWKDQEKNIENKTTKTEMNIFYISHSKPSQTISPDILRERTGFVNPRVGFVNPRGRVAGWILGLGPTFL